VVFLAQHCAQIDSVWKIIAFKIAANCLSYMNSCVNPILYAFLSQPFRNNFRRLLFCRLFQSSGADVVAAPRVARASRIALASMGNARQQPPAAVSTAKPDVDVDFEDDSAA